MKGDAFCEHKHPSNCPYIPRRYWCGKEYTSKIMIKIKTEYPISNLFSTTCAQEWMDLLDKSGGILFVGDSVHSHTAFSLMCTLRDDLDRQESSFHKVVPLLKESRAIFCESYPEILLCSNN